MKDQRWRWARYGGGYEVSSAGDKRFSALNARLPDGRTIEEAYQLDVKGYRAKGFTSWRQAKGKPALRGLSREAQWQQYLQLWIEWSLAHPALMNELRQASDEQRLLIDRFATSEISQARALGTILNTFVFSEATCEIKPGGRIELIEPSLLPSAEPPA